MYHDHDLLHDCLSTARIAIFFFVFLLPTADWPFWKIKLLLSEQLPQYFHEYLPNEPTHERTGWYLKLPVITWSLTAKNQNRNFGEVSNQGQNRLKKITKIAHFGETSTIPKTQKKVYDMITSGKDIMIQVRGICYQSKKLILICNNLKLWIEILAKYVNTNY